MTPPHDTAARVDNCRSTGEWTQTPASRGSAGCSGEWEPGRKAVSASPERDAVSGRQRSDVAPAHWPRPGGARLVAFPIGRDPAEGQEQRVPAPSDAQCDVGRTREVVAEGDQAGDEQFAQGAPGHAPEIRVDLCRRDDPAHLPLAVHELEALVDDPVGSRLCFRVGLEPARDRVRMRNATADLIAEPGDCGLDLGRFGAASSETHAKPQRLQFADERVTERRQDSAEEYVSSRFELGIVHLETTVGAPDLMMP